MVESGIDLSADERYLELQFNLEDRSDDSDPLGGTAAPIDWRRMAGLVEGMLAETSDVSLFAWDLRIRAHTATLSDYVDALDRFSSATAALGLKLYPRGIDDRDTGEFHCNAAVAAFGAEGIAQFAGLRLWRGAPLTVREAAEAAKAGEAVRHAATLGDWFADGGGAQPPDSPLLLATRLRHSIATLRAYFDHQTSDSTQLLMWDRLDALSVSLQQFMVAVSGAVSGVGARDPVDAVEGEGGTAPTAAAQTGAPALIASREDARRAIDQVIQFFERSEPSHPAPLLLRRAQRLVGMGFEEIVNDMLPHAGESLKLFSGEGQK